MKPKNLIEVKSQDEFLEYLIDNYYHILGEGNDIVGLDIRESYYTLTVSPSLIVLSESLTDNDCWFAEYMKISSTRVCSVQEYKEKIKSLRNKPSFEDHPDAECFVQDARGSWHKNIKTSHVIAQESVGNWAVKNIVDAHGWVYVQLGQVIGDWKQTFEKAPEKQNATEHTHSINDLIAQYMTSYMKHACEDRRQQDEIEYLEEQIQDLKAENQDLKTKLDHIKQTLY